MVKDLLCTCRYPVGLQSYYLLKAVGGPRAYLNGALSRRALLNACARFFCYFSGSWIDFCTFRWPELSTSTESVAKQNRGRDPGVASTTGGGAKKPNWEPDWAEAQRIATACPDAAAFSDYEVALHALKRRHADIRPPGQTRKIRLRGRRRKGRLYNYTTSAE